MNLHLDLAKICSYPSLPIAIQLLVILQNNLLFFTLKQMTLLFVEGWLCTPVEKRERKITCSRRQYRTYSCCQGLRVLQMGHAPGKWCGTFNHVFSFCKPFFPHSSIFLSLFVSLTSHCDSVCVPLIKFGLDRPDNSCLTLETGGNSRWENNDERDGGLLWEEKRIENINGSNLIWILI